MPPSTEIDRVRELEATALVLDIEEVEVLKRLARHAQLSISHGTRNDLHLYEACDGALVRSVRIDPHRRVYGGVKEHGTLRWIQTREEMYREMGL